MAIINLQQIENNLAQVHLKDYGQLREILDKALELKGLSISEVAFLLQLDDEELWAQTYEAARQIKHKIYGPRIVIFAPLYLSNYCTNNCRYCGFSIENREITRKVLFDQEIVNQAKILEDQGHKRILLVSGEHPNFSPIEYVSRAMDLIYKNTGIRRINVNIAPLSVEDFQVLKAAGIGTYQLFQETYHPATYRYLHSGRKQDYEWRITAFDRAMAAGIDDVGMGILFGLYDYKFELLALLQHAAYLEDNFGVGPHTISVPRMKKAQGAAIQLPPVPADDATFRKIVAILRLAVPYTGLILSTREAPQLRDELLSLGVSQISAGSCTSPGGYGQEREDNSQFSLEDTRSLDEVIHSICQKGYLPSFCTACYRNSRTGKDFMDLAKTGEIKNFCNLNAILTFKENLLDYASPETRRLGEVLIASWLENLQPGVKDTIRHKLNLIEHGSRDLYY